MSEAIERDEDVPVVEFNVAGMTCSACAARIERKLNAIDGVRASVNYATERALVTGLDPARTEVAVQAIERAGYRAAVREPGDDAWSRRAATARITSLRRGWS